jgi:hypothetical protein
MARSASFDFQQNRSEIIKDALIEANFLEPSESASADEGVTAANIFNRMIKAFQADGLHMWSVRPCTLFLTKDTREYTFSSSHCTETYIETAMRVAGAATDTTMELDTTTGMTALDNIGVYQDDGTMHWTTIASITDSDTLELTAGLASAAAVDNPVFTYTTKVPRLLMIEEAYYREWPDENDRKMIILSQEGYWSLGSKDSSGAPTLLHFRATLDTSTVTLYIVPSDPRDTITLLAQFPFDDMDADANNVSFPQYWQEAIHYNLAYRYICHWGGPTNKKRELKMMAIEAKESALGYDMENVSIFMQPDDHQWA